MKKPVCKLFCLPLLLCSLLLFSCFDSSTKPDDDQDGTPPAREGMQMLNQLILDFDDDHEITEAEDIMLQSDFDAIEAKFQESLDLESSNPMAHLGLSILEIARLNFDTELWSLIEELDGRPEGPPKRLFNNQIGLLASSPNLIMKELNVAKSDNLSIHRFQNFVIDHVLPRISASISHLNYAVALADSNVILIDTGEEMMEVDRGEIYLYSAGLKMLAAAFNMMVAYDYDLKDEDNSYAWIEDFDELDVEYVQEDQVFNYTVNDGNLILRLYDDDYNQRHLEAVQQEFMAKLLKHNLDNNPAFGTLRSQSYLNSIHSSIIGAATDIRNCVNYIEDEDDNQSDDILKIEHISNMNEELADIDENDPNFMQNWNSICDVATWLENVLNEIQNMSENGVDFQVDLGELFSGSNNDIRDILPYHRWNPAENWVELDYYEYGWASNEHSFLYNNEWVYIDNINYVTFQYYRPECNPIEFTDSNLEPIDEDEYPYFPDYTMGGVFPDMTRDKLIALLD